LHLQAIKATAKRTGVNITSVCFAVAFWGVSTSAEVEEGSAPSTVPPFKKGGRKLLSIGTVNIPLSAVAFL
jgi:hypothetical protein